MTYKALSFVKCTLGVAGLVTFLIILFYLFEQHRTTIRTEVINSFSDLNLNKINTLLSDKEQVALIRQIVNESLHVFLHQRNSALKESSKESGVNPIDLQRRFHKGGDVHSNHSIRNSKLEAFQIQTTMEERGMMYTLLEVFDRVMKKNNITYFMYGGTLLGSFRHHDLVPWDDDLDVIVSLNNYETMLNVFSNFSSEYTLYRTGGHDKFYHKSAKKASGYNWLWPYLDVSYYEDNGTYIKDHIKTYGRWYYFPKEIVFPLHDRPLLNLSLPAPRDTFAFLAWTYDYGSSCVMYGYSHMVEDLGPMGQMNCNLLGDKFPFVEHTPDENGVREILKYKDLEIRNVVINEPRYAVAETFNISLKSGFKMPANIVPRPIK